MKKKLFIISSSVVTIEAFLLDHIKTLNFFFDITVISNFYDIKKTIPRIKKYNINFDRKINILRDFLAFFYLALNHANSQKLDKLVFYNFYLLELLSNLQYFLD